MQTPRLTTERLVLSPLQEQDAEPMAVVLADPELYGFTGGTPPTVDQLHDRYRRQLAGPADGGAEQWHNWVIRPLVGDRPVGYVQATVTTGGAATDEQTAELAWVVGVPWQGRGYAGEAAAALVGWLAGLPVERIGAHIHPDHHASAAVARRIGLLPTGRLDEDGEQLWERGHPAPAEESPGAGPG